MTAKIPAEYRDIQVRELKVGDKAWVLSFAVIVDSEWNTYLDGYTSTVSDNFARSEGACIQIERLEDGWIMRIPKDTFIDRFQRISNYRTGNIINNLDSYPVNKIQIVDTFESLLTRG